MGGYGDYLKDFQHNQFLEKWVPREEAEKLGLELDGNPRFWLASWRESEAKLKELRGAMATVKQALRTLGL